MDVAAKNVVTFQPGKTMEEKVRKHAKPVEPKKKTQKDEALEELDDGGNLICNRGSDIATPNRSVRGAGSEVPGTAS